MTKQTLRSPIQGKKLIIDTDIGPDCDDAGALAVAFRLVKQYGIKIAGICNCTSSPYGAGAIDAIASYYGAEDFSIGEFRGEPAHLPDCEVYNRYLAEHMSERFAKGQLSVLSHWDFYYRILSEAEDQEIVLLLIGQFNALADVMKQYPDLVKNKVSHMIVMAGQFPQGREYNIYMNTEAAQYVCRHFSAPIVFSGWEIGDRLVTGFQGEAKEDETNPVRKAYFLYEPKGRRYSWDLTAVEYAIAGENGRYALSEPGVIRIHDDGSNSFQATPDGNHRYLILISELEEHIAFYDQLLTI